MSLSATNGTATTGFPWPIFCWVALGLASVAVRLTGIPGLISPPEALFPLAKWMTEKWDVFVGTTILGLFTVKQFTRAIVGYQLPDRGVSGYPRRRFPSPGLAATAWRAQIHSLPAMDHRCWPCRHRQPLCWWLAHSLMMLAVCLYFIVFGTWNSTMLTVASILVSVPVGLGLGLAFGIWCFKRPHARRIIIPTLDLMQTVPFFSYMVPIVVLVGVSPVAGVVATVIFSMPPMGRVTMLALRQVPSEAIDFGIIAGCRPWQLMWLVRIPAARDRLLLGLNQVVMLTLNLVILASVIGGRGVGFDVWSALNPLNIGKGP